MRFPEGVVVSPVAGSVIDETDQVLLVIAGDPVDEIGGDAVAGIVLHLFDSLRWIVGAFAFGFVKKPSDVVGDALGDPAGGALGIRVDPAGDSVVLDHVDEFVNHAAFGFAVELVFEPRRVHHDAGACRVCGGAWLDIVAKGEGDL